MVQEREELEEYRRKVFDELCLRVEKLKLIEGAISSNAYLLDGALSSRALKAGDTTRVLASAARAAKLRRQGDLLGRQRAQAFEDLKRAEERLADIDRELEAFGAADTDAHRPNGDKGDV